MFADYKNECEDSKLKDILSYILSNFDKDSQIEASYDEPIKDQ